MMQIISFLGSNLHSNCPVNSSDLRYWLYKTVEQPEKLSVRILKMKEQIFLFSLIVHINASILCYDSLLGLGIQEKLFTELSYKTNEDSIVTASCCQSNGTCHGGFVLPKSELKEFINPEKTSIHLRTKRLYFKTSQIQVQITCLIQRISWQLTHST